MAMGRQKDGQGDLMVSWSEMPRSPGHVFYGRLQSVLIEGGFDAFAEAGSVRRFVLGPFCQTLTNLSPKMTANCVLASNHSRGGRFHVSAA